MNLMDKETKDQECESVHSNFLQKVFFKKSEDIECKSIQ